MDENLQGIILGVLITGITALVKYLIDKDKINRDKKEQELRIENLKQDLNQQVVKANISDDILKMIFYNTIKDTVEELFKKTKVDRFLVIIARNGETDPKFVDVILDWYKNPEQEIDAVKVYSNVPIDPPYVDMVHRTFHQGFVNLETAVMEEQILKHYYKTERVNFSRTNPITKEFLDENKALLVFTSSATHENENFTVEEQAQIDLFNQGQIKKAIEGLLGIKR